MNRWFSILLCASAMALASTAGAREIVIASIEENPASEIAKFQPLASYLAARLKDHGVTAGRVVVVQNIEEMADLINAGQADVYFDSVYPVLSVGERTSLDIRLRRWKKGKSDYNSVIIAMKDSGISRLEDLRGKLVAFESASSTSGYYLPLSAIENAGLQTTKFARPPRAVPPDRVGYVFSGDEENSIAMLLRRRVDAIGAGAHDYAKLKPKEKQQVSIIHKTGFVPRQLVALRAELDDALSDRIVDILKGMEASAEGRKVLEKFERTKRFDDVPDEGRKVVATMRNVIRSSQ